MAGFCVHIGTYVRNENNNSWCRQAYLYMVERGYSEEDRDKMVEAMLEEGWQRSDNLPQVWTLDS